MADVFIDGERYVQIPTPITDGSMLAALDVRFDSRDLGEQITVRDYLFRLLETLWNEGEGFSGKRPFGNSGWEYDIYSPLIAAGFIEGELDSDGCVQEVSRSTADPFIADLIKAMCYGVQS